MKVIVINGSYRKTGMTQVLIDSFVKGFKSNDPRAEITIVGLNDLPVEFCRGCDGCSQGEKENIGSCPINDPAAGILQKMIESDRVVFATPVYCHAPTAVMKRFLERSVPLFTRGRMGPVPRNKVKAGRKGLVMMTSGAPHPVNVLMGMTAYGTKMLKRFCKACGCEKTYVIRAGGMETNEKCRSKWAYAAYTTGSKLAAEG